MISLYPQNAGFTNARDVSNYSTVSRIGNYRWCKPNVKLSEFPSLGLHSLLIDLIVGHCHYVPTLQYGREITKKSTGCDLNGIPFLRTTWKGRALRRQSRSKYGKRGLPAVRALKTQRLANPDIVPVDDTPIELVEHLIRRAKSEKDKYVLYFAEDQLGFVHMFIDDASCASRMLAVQKLLGPILDIRDLKGQDVYIRSINVCAPSLAADMTNDTHIGFVGTGPELSGSSSRIRAFCFSNSTFAGWIKKFLNFVTGALFAGEKGCLITHGSAIIQPTLRGLDQATIDALTKIERPTVFETIRHVRNIQLEADVVVGPGSFGKTEYGFKSPDHLWFSGYQGRQRYCVSKEGRLTPIKVADDILYLRVLPDGSVVMFNAENGILHRPEGGNNFDPIMRYIVEVKGLTETKDVEDYIIVDNFACDDEGWPDFSVMLCLDGEISDNSRVIIGNEQLDPNLTCLTSIKDPVNVRSIVLGSIFPSAYPESAFNRSPRTKVKANFDVPNIAPVGRFPTARHFCRAYLDFIRITTQSFVEFSDDPNALRREGFGTLAGFCMHDPVRTAFEQVRELVQIDTNKVRLYCCSTRHVAYSVTVADGGAKEGLYYGVHFFKDLNWSGVLESAEYVPDPTGMICEIPLLKGKKYPPYLRTTKQNLDRFAAGYRIQYQVTNDALRKMERVFPTDRVHDSPFTDLRWRWDTMKVV